MIKNEENIKINEIDDYKFKRISKFVNYINTVRSESEIGKKVSEETEKVIAYMQKQENLDKMYVEIEEHTKRIRKQQRENTERRQRNARNDFEDLGIGQELY